MLRTTIHLRHRRAPGYGQAAGEGEEIPAIESTYSESTGVPIAGTWSAKKKNAPNSTTRKSARPTTNWAAWTNTKTPTATSPKSLRPHGPPGAHLRRQGHPIDGLRRRLRRDHRNDRYGSWHVQSELRRRWEHDRTALPNGLAEKITYDETGAQVAVSYEKESYCSSNCTWLEFSQQRSIQDEILSQQGSLSSEEYEYDKAGRLPMAKDAQGGLYDPLLRLIRGDSNRTSNTTRQPKEGGGCDTTRQAPNRL